MNILHMKYAYEVARVGSLSKAAEILLTAAPNISRSIKELESDLGITIFERSTKGMFLTAEGEEFMEHAKEILSKIDNVEHYYRMGGMQLQKFSASVPRACYISEAFARFSAQLGDDPTEFFYLETNSQNTIDNVVNNAYRLGIIRYADKNERIFKSILADKGLRHEVIAQVRFCLIMSREHPLANKETISLDDLHPYLAIGHADSSITKMPMVRNAKIDFADEMPRHIYIFERATQFELLRNNPQTFMWVSPVPDDVLQRNGLVQRKCVEKQSLYHDVLIYKKGHKLTDLEKKFLEIIHETKACLSEDAPNAPW